MRLRLAMIVVGVVTFAAAASGIGVRASYGARVTGDEPQYLITAISLGSDGDLNVADEIEREAYLPFHEIGLDTQTAPLEDGSEISPHDPGLPAVLALPMMVGGWVAAKLTLAMIAALLAALLVWVSVVRFGVAEVRAAIVVGVLGASAPLAVYGQQVYPEIPAALAVTVAIACLTGRLAAPGMVGVAASVVSLPWLSVKYAPIAMTIGAIALWSLWKRGRSSAAICLCLAWAGAGVFFLVSHMWWYGAVTPYATGDHFISSGEFGVVGSDPDYPGRSVRLVGLLVDQRFGLAAWQPAWLLMIPALAALVRTRPQGWFPLIALLLAGWLTATFVALTMHGWWSPGRQVVVVLPCAVIALAWWSGTSWRRTVLIGGFGALGVVTYAWMVGEGLGGGLTWAVDFFETSYPWYRGWSALLPDYTDAAARTWALHALWIVLAAGLAAWGWISSRSRSEMNYPTPNPIRIRSMTPTRSRT
jgi:hypothetical protein